MSEVALRYLSISLDVGPWPWVPAAIVDIEPSEAELYGCRQILEPLGLWPAPPPLTRGVRRSGERRVVDLEWSFLPVDVGTRR